MKVGVSTYSFSRLFYEGSMTQFESVAMAKEMGFDFIEFSGLMPPAGEGAEAYAGRLAEECKRVGIRVASYTVGADLINGSGGDLNAEIERLKGEVRIAEILGAPCMRHDATSGFKAGYPGPRGFEDALPRLIKGCRAVTEYAEDHGIRTMVENHGFFCQESGRMERLVNGVNHRNFGLLVDIGNFLCVDEEPATAVGRLAPYAFHVHVKDFHRKPGSAPNPGEGWFTSLGGNYLRGAIIGHGDVPVLQCLKILKRAGYDGNISIEFEGIEEPMKGISIGLKNIMVYCEV